jgi:hypothetical protein
MRVRNFLFIIIFNAWEYFWNFMNQHKDVPDLVLSNGELLEGTFPAAFHSHGLQLFHGLSYIYYPISCAA